eukprot:TRINITY_DN5709_c0_g1_i1.p1 TRINITY_DN5709_c0_g1~~TRINITY_DN5709_c0_g1_i1.p1  ORF type:complete len:133 (-),score=27.29 TRINITY_DN5709_c0_g1_i1:23-421(-)
MTGSYYRGAHGIFLVYDVTSRESFEYLDSCLAEIETYAMEDVVVYLLANKIDELSKVEVTKEEGQAYADQHKIIAGFRECSAKLDISVDEAFEHMINEVIDTPALKTSTEKDESSTITVNTPQNTESQYCYC